jgi:hypothetical protein
MLMAGVILVLNAQIALSVSNKNVYLTGLELSVWPMNVKMDFIKITLSYDGISSIGKGGLNAMEDIKLLLSQRS